MNLRTEGSTPAVPAGADEQQVSDVDGVCLMLSPHKYALATVTVVCSIFASCLFVEGLEKRRPSPLEIDS